MQPLMVS